MTTPSETETRALAAPAYRVAVLADLHGNGPALQAVLDALRPQAPYLLVIAGDLIGGPHQEEIITRLRDMNALIVRGNAEDYLTRLENGSAPTEWRTHRQFAMMRWVCEHLRVETIDYLRDLPARVTIELPGAEPITVFHGTPWDSSTHLYPCVNPDALLRALHEVPQGAMVCGHTHIPWLEKRGERLALNPGAVCAPVNGQVGAQYVVLDWDGQRWQASFHCVPYDIDAFRRDFIRRGILATGPLARAHLGSLYCGQNLGEFFLHYAHRLTEEHGYPQARFIPDDIWELAGKTFDWQE